MADEIVDGGQEPQDAPQAGSVSELPEWAQAEIEKARSQAARYRVERNQYEERVKELSPQAERLAQLEEAQKTEAEKLADKLAKLQAAVDAKAQEAERNAAEAKLVRLAAKAGIDPDLAALLDISRLDLEDEDAVIKTLQKFASPKASGGGPSNPSGEGQGKPSDDELRDLYFGAGGNTVGLFGG